MARSKSKEENKMTIYLTPGAKEEDENLEELEQKKNLEAGYKVVGALASFTIYPLLIMFLWNWILPGIIGVQAITYFQALGLKILVSLFK